MCGVIYFKGNSRKHKKLIINLLEQSKIRGLHAFGVSLKLKSSQPFQIARMFSVEEAKDFIFQHEFCELIGHTRYDTSGDWRILENNQPVVLGANLLAFNGVIRMSTKEEYQKEFKQQYETANDGEIVLRMFAEEEQDKALHLLSEIGVSFAGIISVNGKSFAIRNVRRPLWIAEGSGFKIVFSTRDILSRAVRSDSNLMTRYASLDYDIVPPMEILWL